MFRKFAGFWIQNEKLSFIVISLTLLAGIFSWFMIPKQYNPDIVVPAYQIDLQIPGYSAREVKDLVVSPLENKLFEIEGVEHVYGFASKDFASVMVSFFVGEEKEKATTRLYNKLNSNMGQKPYGVQDIQIKAIDPDEIPIFSIALAYQGTGTEDINIKLREIALEMQEEIKTIPEISNLYIVGGQEESISIRVDPLLLEAKNIDLLQLTQALQKNNMALPGGKIDFQNNQGYISVNGKLDTINKVKQLTIANYLGAPVHVEDVAIVELAPAEYRSQTWYADHNTISGEYNDAIFLGIAKKKGTNAVKVSEKTQKKLSEIQENLPPEYQISTIQDEGQTAKETTNMLLVNLIQSILIVIIILTMFLGFRNSLNVAISIPLTLSVIFIFALIVGDNINRITLFALILVLGMLVDDATVVVENVNRNIAMRAKTGKSKVEAIFDSISEVELGVMLSTVTRLLAFGAMFFVTGMMGLYMGPIPKYAILAMIISTTVALSINPFLAHVFAQKLTLTPKKTIWTEKIARIKNKLPKINTKKHYDNFKKKYLGLLHSYIGPEEGKLTKRKKFKKIFFTILIFLVVVPPMLGIFKMRMLPKSDQNQIYLWIDNSPDTNIIETTELAKEVNKFLQQYMPATEKKKEYRHGKIISAISYWIGQAPLADFANTFRGASGRGYEHQISMRINLIDKNLRKISSEKFVIDIRPELQKFLQENYPGAQMRLLEDPPGPPVRATFLLEISGENKVSYEGLEQFSDWLKDKLDILLQEDKVTDVYSSKERYKTNFQLSLDHALLSTLGLTVEQVAYTVNTAFMGQYVSVFHEQNKLESTKIYVSLDQNYKNNMSAFQYITLTNPQGQKIPLLEIAKLEPTQLDKSIYSNDKLESVYLYGEMGNNSVIYPFLNMYNQLRKKTFWDEKYSLEHIDFYGIEVRDNIAGKNIRIGFGGERELTIDTFRDLGLAMLVAFIAIFFMMVAQFKGFNIAGVIMTSFLLGFVGVFPGFTALFILNNEYFSATSMIGVIALAGIVVGNAIILVEYTNILINRGITKKMAIIDAARTRLKPIFVTSLTTILGATTILGDPVWSGLALSIIFGLAASAVLTPIVIPIMLYDNMDKVNGQ